MNRALTALTVGGLVLAAAILQASMLGAIHIADGRPDLLLVTVIALAFAGGTTMGATAGFVGGLVFDLATFQTLGVTSLLLTLAGYWVGRYGETTGRGRTHAPLLSLIVMTVAYAVAAYVLHTVLGDTVSARVALFNALLAAIVGNALLGLPVNALVGRLLARSERSEGLREVRLLG